MSRMSRFDWFASNRRRLRRRRAASLRRHPLHRPLRFQQLEDRRLLAVLTVDSLADNTVDDGLITLREAIVASNTDSVADATEGTQAGSGADTILFDASLSGQTIVLGGTEILIAEALTIDASALTNRVTIEAQGNSRIFNITTGGGDFTFQGIALHGGKSGTAGDGGAVRSLTVGNLAVVDSMISGSATNNEGGAIYALGSVTLTNSTIDSNFAGARGGGIFSNLDITLTNSIVSGNVTNTNGAGIFVNGLLTATDSTISGNDANFAGGGLYGVTGVMLYGSTVSNNTASGFSSINGNNNGGGVYSKTTVTAVNSTLSGNTAGIRGGGVFANGGVTLTDSGVNSSSAISGGGIYSNSNVTLTRSMATNNYAENYGGGVYSRGAVLLTDSTVEDNATTYFGGGIWAIGDVTLTRSSVSGNHAGNSNGNVLSIGGGIYSNNDVIVTESTISGNTVEAQTVAYGGGVYANEVRLTNSTVSGNFSSSDGGGIRANRLIMNHSTISGNTSNDLGGGAFVDSYALIADSTISDNSSLFGQGGGIFAGGFLRLTRSTVTENHADSAGDKGGGIWNGNQALEIVGSIIAGNTSGGDSPDVHTGTGSLTVSFSIIGDTTGSGINAATGIGNLLNVDPQLTPLSYYGGSTQTHALVLGSPAIDAGDPSILFNPNEFDQRGDAFLRVVDGDAAGGARIDMGAYEAPFTAIPSLVVDASTDEIDNDFGPGQLSLREAVMLANVNPGADTILFDAGLDGSTIDLVLGEFPISDTLTIDATSLTSGLTIDAQQNSRILNIIAATDNFTFLGLTLTGGMAPSTGAGGGILSMTSGTLTLQNSSVSGNSTDSGGGGIRVAADLVLTDTTISTNSADGSGGGISAGGMVTLSNSYLLDNDSGADGGGIDSRGSISVTGSTITGNTAMSDGGGINADIDISLNGSTVTGNTSGSVGGGVYAGSVTLVNSLVADNMSGNGRGGGIATDFDGNVTITDSTISGNTSGNVGGGIYAGSVTLDNSLVAENTSGDGSGGGIFVVGFSEGSILINSTISGNSANNGNGGGIFLLLGDAALYSSTVTNNYAKAGGGGIRLELGSMLLINSIVGGNTTAGSTGNDILGSVNASYSLIGSVNGASITGTENLLGVNPMLDMLADNGGATLTHALLPGSPAIDAGDPTIAHNLSEFDQRGTPFVRVLDGNQVGGARIDMGAFELQTVDVTASVVTISGLLTNDDTPELTGTVNDETATITVDVAGQTGLIATNNGGGTWTLADNTISPALGDGTYDVVVTATDWTGNAANDATIDELTILPAGTLLVDTLVDEDDGDLSLGDVSLREAILAANANAGTAETILFDAALDGGAINLLLGEMIITDEVTIDARSLTSGLTIDAQLNSRIFNITATTGDFAFAGLTLTRGTTGGDGGAMLSLTTGDVVLESSEITSSVADGRGGGDLYKWQCHICK